MFKSNQSLEHIPILERQTCPKYGTNEPIDHESANTRYTYPKAVIFILCSKFFESFAANGVRTVLALYLKDSLNYSEDFSTSVLHVFNFFGQFCPIFGAILADNYFGNARTIFYFFFFYAVGWIGMVFVTFPIGTIPFVPMLFSSLLLISIGNGNIRACITSLGGHQFKLPEQTDALNTYFSHYYFMYYMGILLSKVVPPAIRADTQCFGKDECYAAVFGFLGTIFLCCWIIFLAGMSFYRKEETVSGQQNICQVVACIWYALVRKVKDRPTESNRHRTSFLEASIGVYPSHFVMDIISFLRVIKLFMPLPIYWALLAQQDSTWTFQATQMNTTLLGVKIEPDQAKALGPIIILALIPIWKKVVIPTFNKLNYRLEPLQSVAAGAISAGLSFVCAGYLQYQIERTNGQQISIAWQFPQFFLLMLGETLLSIPGLQYSYTKAPSTMKSVLTAAWFINCAIGNLMVVIITELNLFQRQSNEFFFYATFMFVCTIVFSYIASFYEQENRDAEVHNFNTKSQNVQVSRTSSEDV
ncbi:solute carrier family 15 member 2 [Bradysia coprophila]|uniref:solute carrier family 15 member 2 n=1 Tax=Bradysia coprophila TaxID=38358 RepID=UPI00187D8D32|nr:solute carrier family 15 member 2 [Bradysia coprophila]XP_037046248.1 solute carrier family 15 member 2 [Bradysia coprophila]